LPTTNQLVRKGRSKKRRKDKTKFLEGNPMLRGTVLRTFVIKPRKPNSAERKACRVRLSNGNELTAHFPGKGHTVQEHHSVLVRGGSVPDLPGVKYRVIRGNRDCGPVLPEIEGNGTEAPRKNSRSRYGVPTGRPKRPNKK
jgi:small subunit ribosomal protein S12